MTEQLGTLFEHGKEIRLSGFAPAGKSWDVFVSHKSDDASEAIRIAKHLDSLGLSAFVDVLEIEDAKDNKSLDKTLQGIICASKSLLTVVSEKTKESWWVPFEVGIAFDRDKFLGSVVLSQGVSLPLFLENWPISRNYKELGRWAEMVKEWKQAGMTSIIKQRLYREWDEAAQASAMRTTRFLAV